MVVEHHGLAGTQRQHRLDGQHRSVGEQRASAGSALVGQKRIHVHLPADTVPAIAGDDSVLAVVPGFCGVGFDLDGV